jgi:two-component system cell cycle sensor histidine kinase PleC
MPIARRRSPDAYTSRKRTEEALYQSERLFATVFQSSPDIMIVRTAEEGRLVDVNDALLTLRQLKREDVIGRTGQEVGLWEDPAQRAQVVEAVRKRGAVRDLMTSHHSVDPEKVLRHYVASAELVHVNGEELLVWSARDITELRRTEAELLQSKEAAEQASRAKSEFLANMSHELRTPLNAILGFSEVIRDQLFGPSALPRYAEYAKDIHSSGEYLLHIINDILELSKVEAGKLGLHDTDISIETLAQECLRMVESQAKQAKLRLTANIGQPAPVVRVDERSMKQILINLLSNAIKFTPAGGAVSLSARKGRGLTIHVSDSGIGMSDADIAVALTPFGQIESAISRRHQGTGLGLPLAQALVELHGSQLKINSEPNLGTTVSFTSPTERVVA